MFNGTTKLFDQITGTDIASYFNNLLDNPLTIIPAVIDIIFVLFIVYTAVKMLRGTRVWQLIKGIIILVALTFISKALHFTITYFLLSSVMSYGLIMLIIVFQPELRRMLEQLGTTNRFTRFFGIDKDINASTYFSCLYSSLVFWYMAMSVLIPNIFYKNSCSPS